MALKLNKKKGGKPAKVKKQKTPKKEGQTKSESLKPSGFLKRGKAAKTLLVKEQKAAKIRDIQRENQVYRFYVKAGGERTITFLDGGLDEDGDMEAICFYEHGINNAALKYPKYVCINDPANGSDCPLCNMGNDPYFVTVFTVLVHGTWHSKKDKKDYNGQIQLFVAKQGVANKLRLKAVKYGGLKGATFDVTRSNADAFNVGDDFDYMRKEDMKTLKKSFPDCKVAPLDYDKSIQVFSADELIQMGFGEKSTAVGSEAGVGEDDIF